MNRLAVHSLFYLGEQAVFPKVELIRNRDESGMLARTVRIRLIIKI